jgi:predicted DNA-binding protein
VVEIIIMLAVAEVLLTLLHLQEALVAEEAIAHQLVEQMDQLTLAVEQVEEIKQADLE